MINTLKKYIMYIIMYTYQNFNLIFNNLKYFGFLAVFMFFNQILTGFIYLFSKIFIIAYGWFILYFIFYAKFFYIFFLKLKKIKFNLNYFTLLLLPFPNIFFCNEREGNNNSIQVIENTNSLTLLGGILAIGICGLIIYKLYNWYNPTIPPVNPIINSNSNELNQIETISSNSNELNQIETISSNSNELNQIETISSNSNELNQIETISSNSELLNMNVSHFNNVEQVFYNEFDHSSFYTELQNFNLNFSSNFNLFSRDIFTLNELSNINYSMPVSYLHDINFLNRFINQNYLDRVLGYEDLPSLKLLQKILKKLFSLHNNMRDIGIQHSDGNLRLLNYYNSIELQTHEILDLISQIISQSGMG